MIKESKIEKARRALIQQALDEICNVPNYNTSYCSTFCVIAKLGLQMKVKEEKLFEMGDWNNPECHDELIEKEKIFLVKQIR